MIDPTTPEHNFADAGSSVDRLLSAWQVVRICPDQIEPPEAGLSFNPLTLGISVVIFWFARRSVALNPENASLNLLANAISTGLMFGSGFVLILLSPGAHAIEKSKKWGTFFVMTWLVSLIVLLVCCALPFWMGHNSLTNWLIDRMRDYGLFGASESARVGLTLGARDALAAAILSFIAIVFMLGKSFLMDNSFRPWTLCALVTSSLGFGVNVVLLQCFIYGHLF